MPSTKLIAQGDGGLTIRIPKDVVKKLKLTATMEGNWLEVPNAPTGEKSVKIVFSESF